MSAVGDLMNVLNPSIRVRESDSSPHFATHGSDASEATRTELQAMNLIAEALEKIPEEQIRARVLEWASTVFPNRDVSDVAPAQSAPAPKPPRLIQPAPEPNDESLESDLSLEGIESLFDDGRRSPGRFPPSWEYRRRCLSPRLVVKFRWFRWVWY